MESYSEYNVNEFFYPFSVILFYFQVIAINFLVISLVNVIDRQI